MESALPRSDLFVALRHVFDAGEKSLYLMLFSRSVFFIYIFYYYFSPLWGVRGKDQGGKAEVQNWQHEGGLDLAVPPTFFSLLVCLHGNLDLWQPSKPCAYLLHKGICLPRESVLCWDRVSLSPKRKILSTQLPAWLIPWLLLCF